MKEIKLTREEVNEIYLALSVRCGLIETDTIHRAETLKLCKEYDRVKDLSESQKEKVYQLDRLMKKIITE